MKTLFNILFLTNLWIVKQGIPLLSFEFKKNGKELESHQRMITWTLTSSYFDRFFVNKSLELPFIPYTYHFLSFVVLIQWILWMSEIEIPSNYSSLLRLLCFQRFFWFLFENNYWTIWKWFIQMWEVIESSFRKLYSIFWNQGNESEWDFLSLILCSSDYQTRRCFWFLSEWNKGLWKSKQR